MNSYLYLKRNCISLLNHVEGDLGLAQLDIVVAKLKFDTGIVFLPPDFFSLSNSVDRRDRSHDPSLLHKYFHDRLIEWSSLLRFVPDILSSSISILSFRSSLSCYPPPDIHCDCANTLLEPIHCPSYPYGECTPHFAQGTLME
jgi:hypothetical protein